MKPSISDFCFHLLVGLSNCQNDKIPDPIFVNFIYFSSNEQDLSDMFILDIARTVPHGKYYDVGVKLGFPYNYVGNTLAVIQAPDRYKQATTKILMEWKNKHGSGPEQRKELVDILASLGIKAAEGENTPTASMFPSGMMNMIIIKGQ